MFYRHVMDYLLRAIEWPNFLGQTQAEIFILVLSVALNVRAICILFLVLFYYFMDTCASSSISLSMLTLGYLSTLLKNIYLYAMMQ